jgi:uncharacterized protein with von Willebrand factor type A (vWA) domain
MREELHRFFRAARGAGVRVSPAESIDAMRAVADVGFSDRAVLRDALLLTLAKSQDEKQALTECFDLFFSRAEMPPTAANANAPEGQAASAAAGPAATGGDAASQELGDLTQMLLSHDRSAVAAAMAGAANAAALSDIRYFTQRGLFQTRMLEQLGIARLRDDLDRLTVSSPADAERLAAALDALRDNVREMVSQALLLYGREETENLRHEILRNAPLARLERRQVEQMKALIRAIARLRDDLDRLTVSNPADAERLAASLDALRENVRDTVSQALLLYGREESENLRHEILRNAPLARLERRLVEQMKALIRAIARRLRERYSKPRKRQRRGHLDVRKTMRRNAAWGGIPFLTAWKRRHRDRPKVVALCDVSGSVAQISDFFLLLIHSLHEVVDDVRSFAFSGHLIEVSEILDKQSPEAAMQEIMSKVGYGSSDYGRSLADFEKQWLSAVTPKTTVIILGDARTNKLDPRADILRTISERAKRVVWLNPEGRMGWGWGDSEMPRYAPFCHLVRQCATARQLERAVSDIVAAYQ